MKKLFLTFILSCTLFLTGCVIDDNKYALDSMWAFKETQEDLEYDTFFLAPTVTSGSVDKPMIDLTNPKDMSKFDGSIKMEKGLYDEDTRFFAPYYNQALLYVYSLERSEREVYFEQAYQDVKSAFSYYLDNYNNGNKIILAGFSQGADMCLRLLSDFISDDRFYNNFVVCYAIGALVTDEYLESNDRLVFAQSETDQKVIVSWNTEDPNTIESLFVYNNEKSNCINPLTWSTSYEVASKSLNKGAVFLNTYGEVTSEVNNFTGCYIDESRGVLKVTDVNKDDYNSMKDLMGDGVFHLYDYQFFYENLKENVKVRIKANKENIKNR